MNDPEKIRDVLNDYDRQKGLYDRSRTVNEALLKNLLSIAGYRVHSVTSRLKDRQSLLRKLRLEDKNYSQLADITDLVGIRVITHFEDEVDKIGTLIEQEFEVDEARSIDKRKTLDPDRFGYLSLHYICRLNSARARLTENRDIKSLFCEVQVRSILQHAWAEIEHDLGYKGRTVPPPIRRRFSRLAGMLEVADVEFTSVRDDLENYEATVISQLVKKPETIGLDAVSVKVFIARDRALRQVENAMARSYKAPIRGELQPDEFPDRFRFLGLNTLKDLRDAVRLNRGLLHYRWKQMFSEMPRHSSLPRGFGLFHLFQIMVVQHHNAKEAAEVFRRFFGWRGTARWVSQIRRDIRVFHRRIKKEQSSRHRRAPHR